MLPDPVFVAAETAWRMMTKRDPFVNMLRSTMAVVAAGLGGADAITVLPHTAAIGLPDGFARRIARNTQLILLEESNLAKVADPTAGSGGFESLTSALCDAAWSLFQEIEKAGGIDRALAQGLDPGTRSRRCAPSAKRRSRAARTPSPAPANFPISPRRPRRCSTFAPSPSPRPAERHGAALPPPRRAVRGAARRRRSRTASRHAAEGLSRQSRQPLADFTARATFAKNFFEAGGIEAVTNDGFASRDDMVAAFKASGATLACLCSSDDGLCRRSAKPRPRALRAAGAKHIYLGGPSGRTRSRAHGRRDRRLHLCRLRRGGDAEGGARGAGDPGGRAKQCEHLDE